MMLLHTALLPLALCLPLPQGDGFLGVYLPGEDEEPAVVQAVIPGSPAAEADLRTGDTIVAVDDDEVETVAAFMKAMESLDAGDEVELGIRRDDSTMTKTVELAERPERIPSLDELRARQQEEEETEPLRPRRERAQRAEAEARARGGQPYIGVMLAEDELRVSSVVPDSPAQRAGVEAGDRIVALGRFDELGTFEDLRSALGELTVGQTLTLEVERDGDTRSLRLTLGSRPDEAAAPPGAVRERARAIQERAREEAERVRERAERAHEEAEERAERAREEAEERAERAREKAEERAERAEAEAGQRREQMERRAEARQRRAEERRARTQEERATVRAEHTEELRRLREELRQLRQEIQELKELVKRQRRDR